MINIQQTKQKCCEDISLIENYAQAIADTTQMWDCHHRLGIQSDVCYSKKELKAMDVYYDRPAYELIFLTKSEHISLHMKGKTYMLGKHHSAETKTKISKANKGKRLSAETKAKIGEAHKGKHLSDEAKIKISAAAKGNKGSTGKICINNGVQNRWQPKDEPIPEGFVRGQLRKKI